MFKFDADTFVTPAVKGSKMVTSMIAVEPVRKAVEATIEANAEFAKAWFDAFSAYTSAFQKISIK